MGRMTDPVIVPVRLAWNGPFAIAHCFADVDPPHESQIELASAGPVDLNLNVANCDLSKLVTGMTVFLAPEPDDRTVRVVLTRLRLHPESPLFRTIKESHASR